MVAHHQGGKHQGGSALSIRAVSRPLEHPLRASTLKILDEHCPRSRIRCSPSPLQPVTDNSNRDLRNLCSHQLARFHEIRAIVTKRAQLAGGQMRTHWHKSMLALSLTISTVAGVDAQTVSYPNKPVQIIADSSAGSTPDVALRLVADRLSQSWGQQILVVNRPGAGGSVAARAGSEAEPDG